METKYVVITIILVLILVLGVVQAFQMNSLKSAVTGNAIASGSTGPIDISGWTEQERMMYEHHGTLPTRLQNGNVQTAPASSGMVGGC